MKDHIKSTVLALAACALLYFTLTPTQSSSIDLLGLWLGTSLSFNGENPYDWGRLVAERNAIDAALPVPWPLWNPPWTFVVLGPLLTQSFTQAINWWFLFSLLSVGVLLFRGFSQGKSWSPYFITAALIYLVTYPPLISHLLTGHILLPLTVLLAWGLSLYCQGKKVGAGLLLSLTLVKPNLFLFLYAVMAAESLRTRDLKFFLGASLGFSLLVAGTFLVNAELFRYYWAIFPGPSDWRTFPLAPLSLSLQNSTTVNILKHLPWIAASMAWFMKGERILSHRQLFLFAIPISLLFSPHAHPYDFVVLIPSLMLAIKEFEGCSIVERGSKILVICGSLLFIGNLMLLGHADYLASYLYLDALCIVLLYLRVLLYRGEAATLGDNAR